MTYAGEGAGGGSRGGGMGGRGTGFGMEPGGGSRGASLGGLGMRAMFSPFAPIRHEQNSLFIAYQFFYDSTLLTLSGNRL